MRTCRLATGPATAFQGDATADHQHDHDTPDGKTKEKAHADCAWQQTGRDNDARDRGPEHEVVAGTSDPAERGVIQWRRRCRLDVATRRAARNGIAHRGVLLAVGMPSQAIRQVHRTEGMVLARRWTEPTRASCSVRFNSCRPWALGPKS
jgi:hypothetical protein